VSPGKVIALLRRVSAALIEAQHQDAPDFAARLQEYVAGACHGVTLGQAFGLEGAGTPWWQLEQRQARDSLIRDLAAREYPGQPVRAIVRAIRRRPRLLAQLRATGAPTSDRTLQRALRQPGPLPVAQQSGQAARYGNRTRTPTRP
jgi:hypothetical protein